MNKKILCIGEALIDMICTDKGKPLSEGEHFLKKPGGAPTNVAAAIAALGGQVELAAKVGSDPFGKHLVDVMNSFGVSTKWVIQDDDFFTTFAFVSLMEGGERDFFFNRGADGQLSHEEVENIDLDEFSIVHFGSATGFLPGPLQHAYRGLLNRSLKHDVLISFDPNYRNLLFGHDQDTFIKKSGEFLDRCHYFKVSDEEALLLTRTGNLEEAISALSRKSNAVFTVTLGKDGTLLRVKNKSVVIPSIPVDPVDTTGAGDAFVGAVLFQLSAYSKSDILNMEFDPWKEIIFKANKAGARTCEYMGAMEAYKYLNKEIFN